MSKSKANKMGTAVSGQQQNGAPIGRRINRALEVIVGELRSALKTETSDIIKIGELLVEAKTHVQHGRWLAFLKKFSMSERSAQRYMKAYQFVSAKNVTVTDLDLSHHSDLRRIDLLGREYVTYYLKTTIGRTIMRERRQLLRF